MSIAVSPVDPTKLLVGANTIQRIGDDTYFYQGYYYSHNAGTDWAGGDTLPGITSISFDPAVAFDTEGNAFFHFITYDEGYVKKSTDGGVTWQESSVLPGIGGEADKGHMAIAGNDNIFVGLTHFVQGPGDPVMISRSTDGGASFLDAADISGAITSDFSMGVNLAIGSADEVYAVWAIADDWGADQYGSDGIGFNKSIDGGETWQEPARIFDIDGSRDFWDHKNPDSAEVRMNDFPCIAVDRSGGWRDGTIYMVWGEKGEAPDISDILFSRSANEGATWSAPVRIHDDNTSNDQWFPWITIDDLGVIHIVFYDSRNDPNNQLTEVWVAQSIDGGHSFTNFRVSDVAFMPVPIEIPEVNPSYMGDYIGITSTRGKAYASWMDNRTGIYQAYVDIIDNTVSGTITENTTWSGYKLVTGDVVLNDEVALTIDPGTHIAFAENAELYINGIVIAEGTQSDPIIFTGDGGVGLGIGIDDQAWAQFRYCHFTDIGVLSSVDNGAIPDPLNGLCIIERCTFENGSSVALGISGVNNRSVIRNCQFSNSQYGIVSWDWAEPEITGCIFTGNDGGILSAIYSKPLIRGCTFDGNNNGIGLEATISSAPKLWKVEENAWVCSANNNVFTQCNPAVLASGESYPRLGFNLNIKNVPEVEGIPEGYGRTGWNRFYDNNVTDIVNNNQFAIYAIGNNWYPPHPLGLVSCSESEADTVGAVVWEPTVYGLVGNNVITDPPEPDAVALPPGRLAEGEGDFELALELYDEMVNNEQSVAAVYGVARCLWQQDNVTGIIDKMDEYSQLYPGSAIEEQSVSILASYKLYLAGNANLNEALEHIDYLKLNYPTTELEPKLLFEEAQVHEKLQGSAKMMAGAQRQRLPVKAETAYSILAEKYPDTPLGVLAAIMVGEPPRKNIDSSPLPENFILASNYPNPFNPNTTIRYGLPENSDVTLIVYDITGREIIQLVDSRVPAGDRRVIWNGRDRHGNPVASGLYIYRLVAKSNETKQVFTQSNKMVLMK